MNSLKPLLMLSVAVLSCAFIAGAQVRSVADDATTDHPKDDAASDASFDVRSPDGKYQINVDCRQAPDMKQWAQDKLAPVLIEWYPKIVQMLPSDGYTAPARFTLTFENPGRGVAATGGTHVMCNADWMKKNEKGESVGAIVHEMVHVVQQYGRVRRNHPDANTGPGWMTEGIADYIRWFKYEPQSHGAEISKRGLARAKYDASYRVTANFLNWVSDKYDKDLVEKMNAAMRQGKYDDDLWKKYTGKTVQELGDEWKADLEKRLGQTT